MGAPVLPGAMFLLGYYSDETPVMGLPGCVMYAGPTIFDLVLPRIAAGVELTRDDFSIMGGGRAVSRLRVLPLAHLPLRVIIARRNSGAISSLPLSLFENYV